MKNDDADDPARAFDPVTFCFLKVPPADYASQLTLLDLQFFQSIQPEELTSCGWNRRDKLLLAPNVVNFTHRFNQTCLWCQREVLGASTVRLRSEIIVHFIKIAKSCLETFNNLHSCFAIISGLQSSAIYRLSKTWVLLSSKERTMFEKSAKLFSDKDNFAQLRNYMKATRAPCVPYLGIYLADLTFIDLAHPAPHSQLMDKSNQRDTQMNNILRVLADFQQSTYSLRRNEPILQYLSSVRYIDELQKFVEDDNYKLSLELEPKQENDDQQVSRTDRTGLISTSECSTGLNRVARGTANVDSRALFVLPTIGDKAQTLNHQTGEVMATTVALKGKKAHRKCHSLGNHSQLRAVISDADFRSDKQSHRLLIDDSVIDNSSCCGSSNATFYLGGRHSESKERDPVDSGRGSQSEEALDLVEKTSSHWPSILLKTRGSFASFSLNRGQFQSLGRTRGSLAKSCRPKRRMSQMSCARSTADSVGSEDALSLCDEPTLALSASQLGDVGFDAALSSYACEIEGHVRRKTLQRNGKRPLVNRWSRYWISLRGPHLVYYVPNPVIARFRPADRQSYRSSPSKIVNVDGWMVLEQDDGRGDGSVVLQDPSHGHVYKFDLTSTETAARWASVLRKHVRFNEPVLPESLIEL